MHQSGKRRPQLNGPGDEARARGGAGRDSLFDKKMEQLYRFWKDSSPKPGCDRNIHPPHEVRCARRPDRKTSTATIPDSFGRVGTETVSLSTRRFFGGASESEGGLAPQEGLRLPQEPLECEQEANRNRDFADPGRAKKLTGTPPDVDRKTHRNPMRTPPGTPPGER